MGVYIKGMRMPENCDVCLFSDWSNLHQTACCKLKEYEPCFTDFSVEYKTQRSTICPLVELPEKHGRLIDAEALIDTLEQAIAIMETMLKQLDLEADDGCLMELKAYRDIRDGIKELDAILEAEGVEK